MTQGYTGDDFKERGNAHWNCGSNGLNTTGFTALPFGIRYNTPSYKLIGEDAPFYTATKLYPPLWDVGMCMVMRDLVFVASKTKTNNNTYETVIYFFIDFFELR